MTSRTPTETDVGALILRLTVGGLMLFHGVDKLLGGVEGIAGLLAKKGLPSALAYGVYLGEVVGPICLMLGFATRTSAFFIIATMAMAVWLVHPGDVLALGSHGEYALELQLFYAAGAAAIALIGPGRFTVPVKGWLRKL